MKKFLLILLLLLVTSVSAQVVDFKLQTLYMDNSASNSIDSGKYFYLINPYSLVAMSRDDSYITSFNITNRGVLYPLNGYTDTAPPQSIEGAHSIAFNNYKTYGWICAYTDDAVTGFSFTNINTLNFTNVGSTSSAAANPYSLDQCYILVYINTTWGEYVLASANVDDTITLLNVTDKAAITNVSYRVTAANPCSTDDIQSMVVDEDRDLVFGASYTDDTISVWNLSAYKNTTDITCLYNITDSAPPDSLDGVIDLKYNDTTNILSAISRIDNSIVFYNATNFPMVVLGSSVNTLESALYPDSHVYSSGSRDVFVATNTSTALGYSKIIYVNASNYSNITWLRSYRQIYDIGFSAPSLYAEGNCRQNQTDWLETDGTYLYSISFVDDCISVYQIYNTTPTQSITGYTYTGSNDSSSNYSVTTTGTNMFRNSSYWYNSNHSYIFAMPFDTSPYVNMTADVINKHNITFIIGYDSWNRYYWDINGGNYDYGAMTLKGSNGGLNTSFNGNLTVNFFGRVVHDGFGLNITGTNNFLLNKWNTYEGKRSWGMWIGQPYNYTCGFSNSGSSSEPSNNLVINYNASWTNKATDFVCVFGATNTTAYVDGVMVGTLDRASDTIYQSNIPITIGGSSLNTSGAANYYNGSIDLVELGNWSPSSEEIREWNDAMMQNRSRKLLSSMINDNENWSYTAVTADNNTYVISNYNITIGTTGGTDTCTCPGSSSTNWVIDMSDYCVVTSYCLAGNLSFTNSGNLTIQTGIILNVSGLGTLASNSQYYLHDNSKIVLRG